MPPSPPPVVLVVEDHADTRLMLVEWFQICGCRVVEAASAAEGLLRASQYRPDAIITDIALHGIDGLRFCRLLRRDPATEKIPLIAATGWTHPDTIEQARRAGCDSVFVKPYALGALSDEVLRAIATRATANETLKPAGLG